MTEETERFIKGFRSEKELEDYLEAHLFQTGQDLLVIGRQLKLAGGLIDLLAINSTGVIYIAELKLKEAAPSVIAQVLSYRREVKRLNREQLIRVVAHGGLQINLAEAFQRHFGLPLPETLNQSPTIMIIASFMHTKTASSILDLLDAGYAVETFRYIVHAGSFSLVPCCRTDQDMEEGKHTKPTELTPSLPATRMPATPPVRAHRVPVDANIRRFWLTHAADFMPFVTFDVIYEHYCSWAQRHAADGVVVRQRGQFARQLLTMTAETSVWTRVYVPKRSEITVGETPPSSVRTYRASGHTAVAYQLNRAQPS